MNSRQKKTLFADPVSGTIEWQSIESLLIAAGARAVEGKCSAVRFEKGGVVEMFHRPHPAKEARRYQVKAVRSFLVKIGVKP